MGFSGRTGGLYCAASTGALMQACIVSFSAAGAAVGCGENATPMLSCSDVYGNTGGDWGQTCIGDQRYLRWNFSVDPCFCDEPEDNYTLHENSGCAGTWGECGLVGAMPVDCGEGDCEQPQFDSVLALSHPRSWGCSLRATSSPFAPGGQIFCTIPDLGAGNHVLLTLHDSAGRLVRVLIDGSLTSGEYSVAWDGTGGLGRSVPAGVYFCRLSAGGKMAVTPLLLVR